MQIYIFDIDSQITHNLTITIIKRMKCVLLKSYWILLKHVWRSQMNENCTFFSDLAFYFNNFLLSSFHFSITQSLWTQIRNWINFFPFWHTPKKLILIRTAEPSRTKVTYLNSIVKRYILQRLLILSHVIMQSLWHWRGKKSFKYNNMTIDVSLLIFVKRMPKKFARNLKHRHIHIRFVQKAGIHLWKPYHGFLKLF